MKTKFTVERATWYRGNGATGSRLLRAEDGMRCCLGHVGKQCGIPDIAMQEIGSPGAIRSKEEREKFPIAFLGPTTTCNNSPFTGQCVAANDDPNINDEEREVKLIKLFKSNNLELEFV